MGYNLHDWMFELNGIYKIADSEDLYNNKKEDYELNFRVAYKIGSGFLLLKWVTSLPAIIQRQPTIVRHVIVLVLVILSD